jgi:hypothetical protein
MSYTPVNPYVSLAEVREELKMKTTDVVAGSSMEDDLLRAIDNASRWVDDYTRRDFFFHDFRTDPMVFDQFDDAVYERIVFPRYTPILSITEIMANDLLLVDGTDYVVKNADPELQTILSLKGNWFHVATNWWPTADRMTLSIKGTFGYEQVSSIPVTEAGDDSAQLQNWTLQGLGSDPIYWQLDSVGGGNVRVRLFSDAGFANLVASGTGLATSTITLAQQNASGISGTVEVIYASDDTDAANILTPLSPIIDHSQIPAGIPGKIKTATRLVAAALSGRNRKEWIGLDGQKQDIIESEIPKTVFQMLGRRAPVLL